MIPAIWPWDPIRQGVICSGFQQFPKLSFKCKITSFLYLRFVTTRRRDYLVVGWANFRRGDMSWRDKIIFSWWGGGNFFLFETCQDEKTRCSRGGGKFFSFEICHDKKTRCSRGGWSPQNLLFLLTFESTCSIKHEKIILSSCDMSPRDQIVFSCRSGGNFFLFEICHEETTRCSRGGVGVDHFS